MSITEDPAETVVATPAVPELTAEEIAESIRHQNRPDRAAADALVATMDQHAQRTEAAEVVAGLRPPSTVLSSVELLELLVDQPAPGTARAKLAAVRRAGGSPQVPLLEWLTDQPAPEPPALPEPYANPMLAMTREDPRPLTAEELAYLERFRDVPPAQVSADDAAELARLELLAESGAARRLVAEVAAPLRRHHDRLAEETELQAELAHRRPAPWRQRRENLPVLAGWLAEVLADEAEAELRRHLAPDTPKQLADQMVATCRAGAESSAEQVLRTAWDQAETRLAQRRAELEERQLHLAWGGDPKSSADEQARIARAARMRRQPKHAELRDQLYADFGVKASAS